MTTAADPSAKPVVAPCGSCGTLNRVDLSRLADKPKCAKCAAAIALDKPFDATDDDFQTIIAGSSVPVLVDFYADWCGPCRMMAPALAQFASAQAGKVLVLKLDTDANQQTAGRFGIRSIPTLIAFTGGTEGQRHSGMAGSDIMERLTKPRA